MTDTGRKRVLILGAGGMLGHKLYQRYREDFDVTGTVRSSRQQYQKYGIFDPDRLIDGVDVSDSGKLIQIMGTVQPDIVINCVGIIKQLPTAKDPIVSLQFNSLFPHHLANLCRAARARMFHISTDCVFSGRTGRYTEKDVSDATDLYGRTKYLGEVDQDHCLTLRTSIIGRELSTASGLLEWFLGNANGKVKGFTKAIYTGFTTLAMADIIKDLILNHPTLSGIYQVSSDPIDKFTLLGLFRDAYDLHVTIEPESETKIDRSLDSTRFRTATGFQPPSWEAMIREMAADPTPYDAWRGRK